MICRGERGAQAELRLDEDGKFQYSMAYDKVAESAQGTWKVWNKQVVFRYDASARPSALRPLPVAPAVVQGGQLLVDLRYNGKSLADFQVEVLGDAPLRATGRTGADGWRTAFEGPVRLIAVSHPQVNQNKWMTYAVPAADALRGSYRLDLQPPKAVPLPFNFTFEVRDGALIWNRQGSELLFKKR